MGVAERICTTGGGGGVRVLANMHNWCVGVCGGGACVCWQICTTRGGGGRGWGGGWVGVLANVHSAHVSNSQHGRIGVCAGVPVRGGGV